MLQYAKEEDHCMACTATHTIQLSLFHQWLVQASGNAVSEARNHSLNFNQSKECPVPRASLKRQQQTLGGSLNDNGPPAALLSGSLWLPERTNANISEQAGTDKR